MSSPKVFISYSRDDREFVEKLVRSLEQAEIEPWYDYELLSGQDWDDALEEQILACSHMVIVLSETSVASDNVKNEMRFALDHRKHIHPILYEPCSVPLSMRRMHYIDFNFMGYKDGVERLAVDIRKAAGQKVKIKIRRPKFRSRKVRDLAIALSFFVVLAVGLGIWKFWPEISGLFDSKEKIIKEDFAWQKIKDSDEITEYVLYASTYKNEEGRLKDATLAIYDFLKEKGSVLLDRDQFDERFSYFVFRNESGDYNIELPNENVPDWPSAGDLLKVKKEMTVMNQNGTDVMSGVRLKPGDLIQYDKILSENNGQVLFLYYFMNRGEKNTE